MAYFSFLVLAPTGLAVSASSTTPVLKLLLERALRFPQAKEMERFTAYLAEDKLHAERERERKTCLNISSASAWMKGSSKGGGKKENQDDFYLRISTACTQKAEHPGCDRHRGEQAEATSLPHLLHIMVPFEIHSDTMHSVAGCSRIHLAPSRGSALRV